MSDDNDIPFLDPGISRTVIALNHAGHVTCDSGDGENPEFEGEPPFVSIVSTPDYLTMEAKEIMNFLEYNGIRVAESDGDEGVKVHASYYPKDDTAVIDVIGVHDSMFPDVIRFNRAITEELQ